MPLDLLCKVCRHAAFTYCITCESRDVQASADEDRFDKDLALDDAVWNLQHPEWTDVLPHIGR